MKNKNIGPTREDGYASLIFILLVSLVVTASATHAFKSVKNTQVIGTAINASTHAETGNWAAAEAFRLYLQQITNAQLTQLNGTTIPITLPAAYGNITAENVTAALVGTNTYQVGATFVNRHAAARSSAKMQVVYNVTNGAPPPPPIASTPSANFNGDLDVSGAIVLLNGGNAVDLAVDGDVVFGGTNTNPINELKTTGSVDIGSQVTIATILADDDVTLANTQAQVVRTMGEFKATGSASVSEVQSNGNVNITASGRFDSISTLKSIDLNSGGTQGVLLAGENIVVRGGNVDSANAVGDITLKNWFPVDNLVSMGDITCYSQWWTNFDTLSANGTRENCTNSKGESGASNVVTPPEPLTGVTITSPIIDVWAIKDQANYVVEYDSSNSRIKVTVNNVNGLIDGTEYTLGKFTQSGAPYLDYLCKTVNSSGNCIAPLTPTIPLCFGYSLYNSCISYNNASKTFTLAPNQTVPGVIFFDGNLILGDGFGMSSILASGDITTQGSFKQWAANRGAYDKICDANPDHVFGAVQARYEAAATNHYPTNLCDRSNTKYLPISAGNIGLAAGGTDPSFSKNPGQHYRGGNITLGASTDIVGGILAGNILETRGNVNIHGQVSAGSYGTSPHQNSVGSKTTIDFSTFNDFVPVDIPTMGAALPAAPVPQVAQVLWSRPL